MARCPLCLAGDQHLPLKVRRAVRCLATIKTARSGGYVARLYTGSKPTHAVGAKREGDEWIVTVRRLRDARAVPLTISGRDSFKIVSGKAYDYRGYVVKRSLRMFVSAREVSDREVQAVLAGLPGDGSVSERHSHDAEVTTLTGFHNTSTIPTGRRNEPDQGQMDQDLRKNLRDERARRMRNTVRCYQVQHVRTQRGRRSRRQEGIRRHPRLHR